MQSIVSLRIGPSQNLQSASTNYNREYTSKRPGIQVVGSAKSVLPVIKSKTKFP